MKSRHSHKQYDLDTEYYDDDFPKRGKKKESHRRREPRNWKKTWNKHQETYDDVDEFYRYR